MSAPCRLGTPFPELTGSGSNLPYVWSIHHYRYGADLAAMFDVEHEGENLPEPSWNVKPTEQIPIVLESAKQEPAVRRLESARWSLVPSFAKELASSTPRSTPAPRLSAEKSTFKNSLGLEAGADPGHRILRMAHGRQDEDPLLRAFR